MFEILGLLTTELQRKEGTADDSGIYEPDPLTRIGTSGELVLEAMPQLA